MLTERLARGVAEIRSGESGLQSPSGWLLDAFGGQSTIAGPRINDSSSMAIPMWYAGVKILAETMGCMPCEVRQPDPKDPEVHTPAFDSRLWTLLHDRPNPELEAGDFWELLTTHVANRGNAYCFFGRDEFGRVDALWPIPPTLVDVRRDPYTRRKMFLVSPDPESAVQMPFYTDDILHFRGFGSDPLRGLSPIGALREMLGRAIAEQDYQSSMMRNGARPSGVLRTDGKLADTQKALRLARRFKRAVSGSHRAGETVILEEGLQWQQVSLSAGDAQFIEQREFTARDVARVLRMPADALLVANGGDMHYTSDESVGLRFLTWTMMPWRRRFEGPLRVCEQLPWSAGAPAGRKFPLFRHQLLLAVDRKTRFEAWAIALKEGWMSPDEVRIEEGRKPLGGEYAKPRPILTAPEKTNRDRKTGDVAGLDALHDLDVERVLELTA